MSSNPTLTGIIVIAAENSVADLPDVAFRRRDFLRPLVTSFPGRLLKALGAAGENFVVAGAQAIKFMLNDARGTKDVDFVLDVAHLRETCPNLR